MCNMLVIDLSGQKKLILIYFIVILVISVVSGAPGGILASMLFAYKIMYNSCMLDEVNSTYKLYSTLPIKRYYYVIEKYTLSVLLIFFGIITSVSVDSIMGKFPTEASKLINYNTNSLKVIISVCIIMQIVLQSVFLIQYFKNGMVYSLKFTRPFSIGLFVIFLIVGQSMKKIGLSNIEQILEKASDSIFVVGIVVYAILVFVSGSLSSKLFAKRQL